MKLFPPKEYRMQIASEQNFYDTSFKAWLLGYSSWFMGRYILHMRYAEWYDNHSYTPLHKVLGGGIISAFKDYYLEKLVFK